ncbi:Tannase/feruloyl esterase [Stachybotrys elegans]|uniref:Carboxylic ester hydrolase n=1 Tax=Stachybotrys elegans TaxID=80388 RepID=A0A8K0SJ15_9HYPO|nr:Tannase/feruloyl esterase [Stachybotrys elegans]
MIVSPAALCVPSTFDALSIPAARVVAVNAAVVANFSAESPEWLRFSQPSQSLVNANFCNVTITYTHPGQGDNVSVETWLPLDGWNQRLQSAGGGGYGAGRFDGVYGAMYGALADGYATSSTDAGLLPTPDPSGWAHVSPGNINWYNLQNLASVSLGELATVSKYVISRFYGKNPEYSYFNGCSQGGRQGLELAQRYPDAYDGIMAGAPGIRLPEASPALLWAQQLMREAGEYPFPCELDTVVQAAIDFCDPLDGVVDGIVGEPYMCLEQFDASTLIGREITCAQTNSTMTISATAVQVVTGTWQGPSTLDGRQLFPGPLPGADLTGNLPYSVAPGPALTLCTEEGCMGLDNVPAQQWVQLWVSRLETVDFDNLSREEFLRLLHQSRQWFGSVFNTNDPDISPFQKAGGKLITFIGLADNAILPTPLEQYYQSVSDVVSDVDGFFRYFEVPGLGHCAGGPGSLPIHLFEGLRAWVENGTAPEHSPVTITNLEGGIEERIICPYPQKPTFNESCAETGSRECWTCS